MRIHELIRSGVLTWIGELVDLLSCNVVSNRCQVRSEAQPRGADMPSDMIPWDAFTGGYRTP